MKNRYTKDDLIEILIRLLADTVGWIKKEDISSNVMLTDLKIDTDDLTEYINFIDKYFGIKTTQDDWDKAGTIEQTADVVLRHLEKKEALGLDYFFTPPRASLLSRIKAWIWRV